MNYEETAREVCERGMAMLEMTEAEALRECARAQIAPFWPVSADVWRLA